MNHRIAWQRRRLAGSSAAVSMLLIFCLNLAVLPCAMALGLDDHDCSHCPPADDHSMAGHHGHEAAHEPELRESDCATLTASCCDVAASNVDTRTSQLKLKSQSSDQPIAGPASQVIVPGVAYAITVIADPPDPPGNSVPRHVLFCVYLD
jgi:hypothetical protein